MNRLTEIKQSRTQIPVAAFGKCPHINVKGKKIGLPCGKTTFNNPFCKSHMDDVERSNPHPDDEAQRLISQFRTTLKVRPSTDTLTAEETKILTAFHTKVEHILNVHQVECPKSRTSYRTMIFHSMLLPELNYAHIIEQGSLPKQCQCPKT